MMFRHITFNPRSRVGNDTTPAEFAGEECLSIHVPAWGTTSSRINKLYLWTLSIHVPAWGTTARNQTAHKQMIFQSTFPRGERLLLNSKYLYHVTFNPRSRVGNDRSKPDVLTFPRLSIHVPAWGTTFSYRSCHKVLSFNPRSRVGNDCTNSVHCQIQENFQSTFPRGERPPTMIPRANPNNFQSTFPRGERPVQDSISAMYQSFQSTFPRGERPLTIRPLAEFANLSIHVPAWGTTRFYLLRLSYF